MPEICDSCHKEYTVSPKTAKMVIFLGYIKANHAMAKCPACGATEIIYMTVEVLMQLMSTAKYDVMFGNNPTDERRNGADKTWLAAQPVATVLPMPPRAWLIELHDSLRTFGGQS